MLMGSTTVLTSMTRPSVRYLALKENTARSAVITTCTTIRSENICATVLEVRRAGAFHSEGVKHDQAGRALGTILVSLVVPRGRARRQVL